MSLLLEITTIQTRTAYIVCTHTVLRTVAPKPSSLSFATPHSDGVRVSVILPTYTVTSSRLLCSAKASVSHIEKSLARLITDRIIVSSHSGRDSRDFRRGTRRADRYRPA